jgi:putative effector of murein hydrolase LrgA (UPF0299 family)
MNSLHGLFIFSAITLICRSIDYYYPTPVPADILGLIALFIYLIYKKRVPDTLEKTSTFIFSNVGLLYIPAGVSLMNYFKFMADYWKVIAIASALTTLVTLIICAAIFNFLEKASNKLIHLNFSDSISG